MAYRLPSGSNTFVPSWETTGLVVSATRDPDQFKLADYMQYVPVNERVFYYLRLDLDEPARVVTTQEYAWAPGQQAPSYDNIGAFTFVQDSTTKYGYPWVLPDEAIDQSAWDIRSSQMGIVQSKCMTNRTILASNLLQTAANWPSSNTDTVNNLNGGAGKWDTASSDPASAQYLAIRKSLTASMTKTILYTNATMKWKEFRCVIDPIMANKMGNTSEINDYLKGSPDALAQAKGGGNTGSYNAPNEYASVKFIVEDAVRVSTRANAVAGFGTGATRGWVWQSASPVLLARKGGLVAQYGGNSLATVQMYFYREAVVYTKSDPDNERQMGRVVDDFKTVLSFPQSGFLLQSAL
jgi:hypothetical protein